MTWSPPLHGHRCLLSRWHAALARLLPEFEFHHCLTQLQPIPERELLTALQGTYHQRMQDIGNPLSPAPLRKGRRCALTYHLLYGQLQWGEVPRCVRTYAPPHAKHAWVSLLAATANVPVRDYAARRRDGLHRPEHYHRVTCKKCVSNAIADEEHALLHCPATTHIRRRFPTVVRQGSNLRTFVQAHSWPFPTIAPFFVLACLTAYNAAPTNQHAPPAATVEEDTQTSNQTGPPDRVHDATLWPVAPHHLPNPLHTVERTPGDTHGTAHPSLQSDSDTCSDGTPCSSPRPTFQADATQDEATPTPNTPEPQTHNGEHRDRDHTGGTAASVDDPEDDIPLYQLAFGAAPPTPQIITTPASPTPHYMDDPDDNITLYQLAFGNSTTAQLGHNGQAPQPTQSQPVCMINPGPPLHHMPPAYDPEEDTGRAGIVGRCSTSS